MSGLNTCEYCHKSCKTPLALELHLPKCREGRVQRGTCYKCGEGPLYTETMCERHAKEMSERQLQRRLDKMADCTCIVAGCGAPHSETNSQYCEHHRNQFARKLSSERRERLRAEGRCPECCEFLTDEEKATGRRCFKCREEANRVRLEEKVLVIAHYGGRCACPGCPNPDVAIWFLTMDHVNNDGNAHRRRIRGTSGQKRIYNWILKIVRRTGKWPEGFQVLCWNCNGAKSLNGGVCPHLSAPLAEIAISNL